MPDLAAVREHYQRKIDDQRTVLLGCDACLAMVDGARRLSLLIVRDRANTTLEACEGILAALDLPAGVALAEAQSRACRYGMLRDLWEEARRKINGALKMQTDKTKEERDAQGR